MAWVPVEIRTAGKVHRVEFSTDMYVLENNEWFAGFAIRRNRATPELPYLESHYAWHPASLADRVVDIVAGVTLTAVGGFIAGPRGVVGMGAANLIGSRRFPVHNLVAKLRGAPTSDQYYEVESGEVSIAYPRKLYLRDVRLLESRPS
jgi:hypothetical protein